MRKTLISLSVLSAALLAPTALTSLAQTQSGQTARVIVKYKADAGLIRKTTLVAHEQHALQAKTLGGRLGLALIAGAAVHERAHVVFANGMSSEQLAATLAQDSEVEYAVVDQRKRLVAAPNDSLYTTVPGSNGPATGQWYLRPNAGAVLSSIDVEPAWAVTTGSSSVVVAVLDTGVRFDHPDLKSIANGGNLLPGYDMISDVDTANDGNGRDADPSDPGDWISQSDINSGRYAPCTSADIGDSGWHGTQTAGLIGARTNNAAGMAGVGRNVRILPVRVLGKCGGFDSDIVAGMRWAAGLAVPGVQVNPNPAKVINMSLGGAGACDPAGDSPLYQTAVNEITAAGVTIIASAGNSTGHAVSSPANCAGVIAVGALRHVGTKVGFSDLGPEISISAPGGNCIITALGTPCLFPILTTSNSGLTSPISNANGGSIYTDSFNSSLGTSFSAPLVAGTAALVLSAQPGLSPAAVRALLRSTARVFPTTGGDNGDGTPVIRCVAPAAIGATQFDQSQCYCTTSTCGAGMLDSAAALESVLATVGLVGSIDVTSGDAKPATAIDLIARVALKAGSPGIQSYQWSIVNDGGTNSSITNSVPAGTLSILPSAAGILSVRLTVTDLAGATSVSERAIGVVAPTPPAATSSGGGALGAGWLVLLLLAVAALRFAAQRDWRA